MDRLEGAWIEDGSQLDKLLAALTRSGIKSKLATQHEVARNSNYEVLAFDVKRVLALVRN